MQGKSDLIHIKRKTVLYFVIFLIVLAIATPALADYLGPNRTVTETTSVCKVVLYECQYVASKDQWKYKRVDDWSCSNEGKPWQGYDNYSGDCGLFSKDRTQWGKEETLQTVTTTHPEATITSTLQGCNLSNGWCNTATELSLDGNESLSGYNILAIEGVLNGQTFACSGSNCNVPLHEGDNAFTFWALSSWGDSSIMGTASAKVDTISPNVGLDVSGSNGTNNWYVSPTAITATGSDSTSGLSSTLLSVNGGVWESSAILNEGVHNISVQAEDNAGNISNSSTTISVDTTTPSINVSLHGTTGSNGWYISNMEVTATANDTTSGIGTLEASWDGNAYANYTSPIIFSDGHHTLLFKATDNAGNETETPFQDFYIDTLVPAVDLPTEWEVNETITYKVQDDGSGLSTLRVVVEDEDERFAKVAWDEIVSGTKFTGEITWDGKFKDGTVAPPGEYLVWIKVTDTAGNERISLGRVIVPQPNSLFGLFQPGKSSTAFPVPPADLSDPEVLSPTTTNPNLTFGGSTTGAKETTHQSLLLSSGTASASTTTNSNPSTSSGQGVLWGATAAALIGWATATALDEQKKRRQQEEAQAAQVRAEVDAFNAAQEAKRIAETQQWKINSWLEGQAMLNGYIKELEKLDSEKKKIEELNKQAAEEGLEAAIKSAGEQYQSLYIAKRVQEATRQHALEEFRRGESKENNVQPEETVQDVVNIPKLITVPIETTPFWKFWSPGWNIKDAWNGLIDLVTGSNAASTPPPPVVIQQLNSTFLIHPPEKIDLSTINSFTLKVPTFPGSRIIPAGTVIPVKKEGDGLHATLDAIGLYPGTGVGEAADLINALIYLSEGRKTEAGISFASVLVFGDFLKAGKWTVKVGAETLELTTETALKITFQTTIERATREALENVAGVTLEKTTKETLERAAKEAVEKAVEKAAKETVKAVLDKIAKEAGGTITKDIAKAVTDKALKDFAETSAEQVAKEAAERTTKELAEKLAHYPLGSPLRLTPAELLSNKEAQQALYDMAKNMRDEQKAFAKELLEKLNISGEFKSILKGDESLEEFIKGVTEKMKRNDYTFVGQMDDMTRGRFNLSSWDDVEAVFKGLDNQRSFDVISQEPLRHLQPNGGHGYPRYHIVFQDTETLITHEWQVGTKATTEFFEARGITIPKEMEATMPKTMHNDLHDIEFDIFRQGIDNKYPDISQEYGIPEFLNKVDQIASETGLQGEKFTGLESILFEVHAEASKILQNLVDGETIDFVRQFYH